MNILIIEDDKQMREMIKKVLKEHTFFDTGNPVEGLKMLKENKIEFIILDIMLPEIDGFMVCQIIRKYPEKYGNPFILMLTSKTEEEDIVKGLEGGADDYIKKPFNTNELTARIKAISRRKERDSGGIYTYGQISLNLKKQVAINTETGEGLELFKKEFDLLAYLIQNKGIVLTRENIYENVWGEEFAPGDRIVDNYIWKLKIKFPFLDENIITVRGMGYKLKV